MEEALSFSAFFGGGVRVDQIFAEQAPCILIFVFPALPRGRKFPPGGGGGGVEHLFCVHRASTGILKGSVYRREAGGRRGGGEYVCVPDCPHGQFFRPGLPSA